MTGASTLQGAPFDRVLVTGGRGFVGRRLVPWLDAVAREVHVGVFSGLDGEGSGAGVVPLDLSDEASVEAAVAAVRPDLVIHLAAQSSVGQGAVSEAETWAVNVDGTRRLAKAVARHSPGALFVFTSSAEVYGAAFLDGVATEKTAPKPMSAYARSKLAAEEALKEILRQSKLIITRPSNHSGPGQDGRFVLPSFAAQIRSGAPIIRVGNLSAERDFLHVDDVVQATLMLIGNAARLPAHATCNISSGQTRSIAGMLDQMIRISGVDVEIVIDPDRLRPSEIPVAAVSPAAVQELTGWRPLRSVDQMLADVLESASS